MNSLKANKLWNVANRAIEISGAFFGNNLAKIYNCVTVGIKIFDIGLIFSITRKTLNRISRNIDNNGLRQSRDHFPITNNNWTRVKSHNRNF